MDETMRKALAASARAFADALDPPYAATDGSISPRPIRRRRPQPGGSESILLVLHEVAKINDEQGRGVLRREMADIARAAGMDPRGMAGYYTSAAQLLKKKEDGRWLTETGRQRLQKLLTRFGTPPAA